MKISKQFLTHSWGRPRLVQVLALVFCTALQSPATIYTFSEDNSTGRLDTEIGFRDYVIDGVDQLNQQSFYYRIGTTGREYAINNLATPSVSEWASGDGIDVIYQDSSLRFTVTYWMEGSSLGSGLSKLHVNWSLDNLTAATVDFHLFQYTDFDLGANSSDTSAAFLKVGFPFWNRATQADGMLILTNSFTTQNRISKVQVGNAATLLGYLTDANTTVLNNVATAGAGNLAYVAQWDISLGAINSPTETALNDEVLSLVVPEPSSLSLIGFGLGLGFAAAQRRSKILKSERSPNKTTMGAALSEKCRLVK